MLDLTDINEKLKTQNSEINRIKLEMDFAKSKTEAVSLKIKPMYLVVLLIAVFFVELISAMVKKEYQPNIILYSVTGCAVVAYIVYVAIAYSKRNKSLAEQEAVYKQKNEIFTALCSRREKTVDDFVQKTGGIKMLSAKDNSVNYLWLIDEILTIGVLRDELTTTEIPYSKIRYVSSDDNLTDYNKILGTKTVVREQVSYAYLFTEDENYVFYADNYQALCKLLPDKELAKFLQSKKSDE